MPTGLRVIRSKAASFLVFALYAGSNVAEPDQQQDLIHRIDAAEESREARLAGYTVTEVYTIRNSHFSRPAEATVETSYKPGQGKTYKVLSRSGPSLLANVILDHLLREESQMSRGVARQQEILTSANYEMKPIGREAVGGRICDTIKLVPNRKSPYLLKGRMWVDAANLMLVKIEGKPPASVSFFEGRPLLVREYGEIDGFALALHSHATSGNFLFGYSTVDIEYRNYHVIASTHGSP